MERCGARSQHGVHQCSTSFPSQPAGGACPPRPCHRAPHTRRRGRGAAALPGPEHLEHLASGASHLLTLGYEAVVLPCHSQNCGDIVYRSTLDPALRMEQRGVNPQGIALVAAAGAYLFAQPGALPGAVDSYVAAPLQRWRATPYTRDDFVVGKKIATGGFGTVYRAELAPGAGPPGGAPRRVILKKATEFGEAEVWMNERLMRAAPGAAATFLGAFADGDAPGPGDPLWLAWAYEGDSTLAEVMAAREWPYNLEAALFRRQLKLPAGPGRKALTVRLATQQLLEGLRACHAVGIVHRDVKPQNCILSEACPSGAAPRLKLIDFGAAADLRIGINYVPNQYLLDPRYAPPQQYIMSSQTPRAPPAPIAALLSPVLWRLNSPDRFDMYSAGVVLLQMAFGPLRSDNALIAFNRALGEQHGYDLRRWRRSQEKKGGREWAEGFAVLDSEGGAGWDLACQLVQYDPRNRLSASGALAHRWFGPSPLAVVTSTAQTLGRAASVVTESLDEDGWLEKTLAKTGAGGGAGLTETQLKEELGLGQGREELPQSLANSSATVAWWQQRQSDLGQRLKERGDRLGRNARKTIKEGSKKLDLLKLVRAGVKGRDGS